MNKLVETVRTLGLAMVALTPIAVFAADARLKTFTDSSVSADWSQSKYWVDGYVPTSSDDVVNLAPEGQETKTVYMTMPNTSFTIDSIVACNTNTFMQFRGMSTPQRVGIRQMSGYASMWPIGFKSSDRWYENGLSSGFNLLGSTAEPTIINSYYLGCFPQFGTPAAANAGEVHKLIGTGMFLKDGAGELTVNGPVGLMSGVFLQEGRLTLSAERPASDDAPAMGAFFHVDASRADTLSTAVEGGATVVTNWTDATGGDIYAYWASYSSSGGVSIGKPRLSAETANGRALVDFGSFGKFSSGMDPDFPGAWLRWSDGLAADVCEVFFAVRLQNEAMAYGTSEVATPSPIGFESGAFDLRMKCDDLTLFNNLEKQVADVRVNGEPVVPNGTRTPYSKMRIVSVSFPRPMARSGYFGRFGSVGAGGFLLGEALVYTNALTETERRQTINYLMKRWLDADTLETERAGFDLGTVVVKSPAADVAVPDGKTVRVRKVVDAEGNGIVKEGDGTLEVARVQPADASVVVNGGSVKFTADGEVPALAALPSGAAFHFDASDEDSFTYESGNLVSQWRDVREGSSLVATNLWYSGGRTTCPVRRDDASPTGLPAVDFYTGGIGSSYKSAPRFVFGRANVREGFIVWKNTCPGATAYAPMHFACNGTSTEACFKTRNKGQLLGQGSARDRSPSGGALWTVNGNPVHPLDGTFGKIGGDDDWVVIHFTSAYPLPVNGMAVCGNYDFGGGCMVGELLGYERLLTDAERRGVEAYLMDRWLGETHPDAKAWTGDLAFGTGADAKIDSDGDLALRSVSVTGASLEKAGAGKLTISAVSSNVTSVVVSGGEFSSNMAAFGDFADAFAHFDASDTGSFEMTPNGDGTYSVTRWYDVRRNGVYADADLTHCRANPIYNTAAATGLASGAGLGYVDFGPASKDSGNSATNDQSSAMLWNVTATNVVEVHLVYADNAYFVDSGESADPVAYWGGNRTDHCGFRRKYSEVLIYKGDNNMMCDCRYNNESKDAHYKKPSGFGVVSLVVTNSYDATRSAGRINSLAQNSCISFGGCRVAEVVVYERELSPESRAAVDAYLMKKWLGIGGDASYMQGPAVSVASGATARLGGMEFADLASLTVDVDASGVAGTLKVDGVFHAPAAFTLTVNLASMYKLGGRSFKLIDADGIADAANVSGWTVSVVGATSEHRVFIDADGDVSIEFRKKGSMLVVY